MKRVVYGMGMVAALLGGMGAVPSRAANCPVGGAIPCIPAADTTAGPLARPPGVGDDAQDGHAVGDLWQVGGRVWQAVSVQPGAAQWQMLPDTTLPGDVFGTRTRFAGGTVRLVRGYVGPALDVEVTHQGQQQTRTLHLTAQGGLDTAPLQERDPGTYAFVTRVYDQSGHGHALEATAGRHVVHIGEVRIAGAEAMSWGEANGPGGFVIPADMRLDTSGFFFSTLGTYASSNAGYAAYPVPLVLGQEGLGFKVFFGSYSLDGFVHVADNASPDQKLDLVVNNAPAMFSVWRHGPAMRVRSGNIHAMGQNLASAAALAGGYLGYNADGGPWFSQGRNTGQWTGVVLADHISDPEQVSHFQAAVARQINAMPQVRRTVVTIGDSRTEGYQVPDGRNWPWLMQANMRYQSYNLAVSGATTRHMLGMLPAAARVAVHAGERVAVVFGGFNDHIQKTAIPYEETVENLGQIVSQLQGMKYHVVLVEEAASDPVLRAQLHAAVQDGRIRPDSVVDPFAPGHPLADPSNPQYWVGDMTHPSALGQAELARCIWRAVSVYFPERRP